MKKRVGYFDIAKGLGIILVVIAHIEYMPLEMRKYIVTFHMPAFFVISGMLMCLTDEAHRPIKVLIGHKLKNIMLPYLVFSIIYPIIDMIRYAVTGEMDVLSTLKQDLIAGITMTGVSVLWFLPALFFSELMVLAIVKNLKKPLFLALAIVLPIAMWFLALVLRPLAMPLWRTDYCCVLVLLGYLLFPLIRRVSAYPLFLLPVSVALFVILYFTGLANGIVDLHYILMGNKLLYYVNAMMGSLALILLSIFIEVMFHAGFSKVLEFFGRHGLFIMVTHMNFFVLYIAERVGFALSGAIPKGKEWVFNITATLVTFLLETVFILLWERIKNYGILFISDKRRK